MVRPVPGAEADPREARGRVRRQVPAREGQHRREPRDRRALRRARDPEREGLRRRQARERVHRCAARVGGATVPRDARAVAGRTAAARRASRRRAGRLRRRRGEAAARRSRSMRQATRRASISPALLAARQDLAGAEAELAAIPEHLRDERASSSRRGSDSSASARACRTRGRSSRESTRSPRISMPVSPTPIGSSPTGSIVLRSTSSWRLSRRDRGDRREQARKAILEVFGLAADQPDVVSEYRRKLAARSIEQDREAGPGASQAPDSSGTIGCNHAFACRRWKHR